MYVLPVLDPTTLGTLGCEGLRMKRRPVATVSGNSPRVMKSGWHLGILGRLRGFASVRHMQGRSGEEQSRGRRPTLPRQKHETAQRSTSSIARRLALFPAMPVRLLRMHEVHRMQ